MIKLALIISIFFLLGFVQAQNPTFTSFEGKVMKLPPLEYKKGYVEDYENYPTYTELSWGQINVPESFTEVPFPDTDLIKHFGIIFHSEMNIPIDGAYEFCLNSDDGSRIWIDGKDALNNDKDHKMLKKCDTIPLQKRTYPLKLWYYQALLDRYGIIFTSKYIGPYLEVENNVTFEEKTIFYKTNQYELNAHQKAEIVGFFKSKKIEKIKGIEILSYTDKVGTDHYNSKLSEHRAKALSQCIQSITNKSIPILSKGMGILDQSNSKDRNRKSIIKLIYED